MKNYTFILMLFLLVSCYHNPIERNTIVFPNRDQSVADSISKMLLLLKRLPHSKTVLNTNFYYRENRFFINNQYVGEINKIKYDTIKDLANYSHIEKNDFIHLANFLATNNIRGAYLDEYLNNWTFTYRYLPDGDFHDTRELIYLKESDSSKLILHYKILDHKKNIFLVAPIDAKIR